MPCAVVGSLAAYLTFLAAMFRWIRWIYAQEDVDGVERQGDLDEFLAV